MSFHQPHVGDLSLGAFDLPHRGLLVRFPLPDIHSLLWSKSQMESESVWLLLDSHAAIAPVGVPWQTGQYLSIQGPLLGKSVFSGLRRAFWHYES